MKRRAFLEMVGRAGGAGAVYQAMSGMGLLATPMNRPLKLQRSTAGHSVLILGGGLAGMSSAYELGKLGYKCRILEARGRAGGRCHTIRGGTVETEIDGQRQVGKFDDGLYFNPGPTRVPSNHFTTLDYLREFNVPVELFCNLNENAYYHSDKPENQVLNGGRIRHRDAKADMYGYVDELLVKAIDKKALDDELSGEDREFVRRWAQADGWLDDQFKHHPNHRRGYNSDFPGGGDKPGTLSTPYDRSALFKSQVGFAFGYEQYVDFQMSMLQVVGGTDMLAKAFEQRLHPLITYGAIVQEIRHSPNGVRVVYRDAAGAVREERADYCICTIPLSVLRNIQSDFAPEMKTAIAAIPYQVVGKIGFQFKRRFWEEDDRIYGGVTLTDMSINQILYPSTGYLSKKGVLVGYYNYDDQAKEFGDLPPAERQARALAQGRKIHPQYDAEFENGFSVAWHKVPYSLGGWGNYSDDHRRNYYPVLNRPDGAIYLAGEHMSYLGSWMAGAFESAHVVVKALHERASKAASTNARESLFS
jgi:monoamine oxidase